MFLHGIKNRQRVRLEAAVFAITLCLTLPAYASRDAALGWDHFEIHSDGGDGSGPVSVSGHQSEGGIDRLTVEAFGRTSDPDQGDVSLLAGFTVNAMQLTLSPPAMKVDGKPNSQGRSVGLLFSMSFASDYFSRGTGHPSGPEWYRDHPAKYVLFFESGAIEFVKLN